MFSPKKMWVKFYCERLIHLYIFPYTRDGNDQEKVSTDIKVITTNYYY